MNFFNVPEKNLWEATKACMLAVIINAIFWTVFAVVSHAEEYYTDEEIVNAIYQIEGGSNAKYPYGIRSIPCKTKSECRRICTNTVKNNRQRFANSQ